MMWSRNQRASQTAWATVPPSPDLTSTEADSGWISSTPCCPQARSGGDAAQAMAIGRDGFRSSQLAGCLTAAEAYLLSRSEAEEIIDRQLVVITTQWDDAADAVRLTKAERRQLWGRQILNPYALEGHVHRTG